MNPNLEHLIKHPIKTAGMIGTGIFLLTNITNAQESIDGTITSNQTSETLPGKKIALNLYDPNNGTFLGTVGPIWTDINGYYIFDNIVNVESPFQIESESVIKYIGNKIYTNNVEKKNLTIYNLLGEKLTSFTTYNSELELNLEGLSSGRFLLQLNSIDNVFTNIFILQNGLVHSYKKSEDKILANKRNIAKKSLTIGAVISIFDSTEVHHSYSAGIGNWDGLKKFNMALPKVIFLPDTMQFTSTRGTYPINTEIRLLQHMAGVTDPDHYLSTGRKLMPLKVFLDTLNCPTGWKNALRNGMNNIRNQTTHHPDSLVQETNEYREIEFENGFSQINVSYVDSTITGEWDYLMTVYWDWNIDVFLGAELKIDTSRGQQPIDVYKAIQRNIQKYFGGIQPIDCPKYLGTDTRGEPYNITTPEMNLIDIRRTFQDIILQNNGQRIWINRFLHPGTVYTSKPIQIKDMKEELLELFNKVPGVKLKVMD